MSGRLTVRERAARPLSILGPTASGKSSLALGIVEVLASQGQVAELVSIDSMQVYGGMDVGTATPTLEEQAAVPHHMINLVSPSEVFTVGEFQRQAKAAIAAVRSRNAVPILVGGTGLYLRSLIDDLDIPPQFPATRADLEAELATGTTVEALHGRLAALDPTAAGRMEPNNERRVLRALEVTLGSGLPFSSFGPGLETYPYTPFVQVAIRWPRGMLNERIAQRYDEQMTAGFLDEVQRLREIGPSRTAAQALGYRELLAYLDGDTTLEEALELAVTRTRRFARRQERWFRRDPRIIWLDAPVDPADAVTVWDQAVAGEVRWNGRLSC
ncbi:MAG: tRNA (adenosine(37)-N6)-dimethylallyltransferase MiaA [Acidimicrobiales bacterium]|nr:tRNA (adenosine(37)-N6)-dimethylallyltransferase MiaA [Acidimicrobiales bacterium]